MIVDMIYDGQKEGRIFSMFRDSNKSAGKASLIIKVSYVKGKETNGGTKI